MIGENTIIDGRYRVLSRIGSGGMADVWCAEDAHLGRKVAIKVLHERFAQDREFVERFRREASAAAGLQHPNVVSVYDRGEFDGTYYIAMEYIDGASLKELITHGLSVEQAVEVTRQILIAARFAHSRGIVHRDLKPHNVLVDSDGKVTVTDFGIARAGASEITQTGSVMGTAHYLSPEQAQGLEVTPASDLYSIGVILYEALTGKVPFEAESAVAVALKQVSEVPRPPSEINPNVPPALDAIVMRALAKDPAQRYADANAFLAALETAAIGSAPAGVGSDTAAYAAVIPDEVMAGDEEERRRKRNRRIRFGILGVLVAAAAAAAAWALTRPEEVKVPNVTGQKVTPATQTLQQAGFDVATTYRSNQAKRDTVLEQDPIGASKAEKGSTVDLTVSSGPGTVKIPSVAGLSEASATKRLEQAGLKVVTSARFSNTVTQGNVIRTDPGAGVVIQRGSTVKMFVSQGVQSVQVPSVVGQTQGSAEAALRSVGLGSDTQTRNSSQPQGQVIDQSPGGGSSVPKGSTVSLVVSSGTQQITVPNVIGRGGQTAAGILRGDGFNVREQTQAVTDPAQDGKVQDQFPSAGTKATKGDTVTIIIGQFQAPTIP